MPQQKTCLGCGKTKPIYEFHKDRQKSDGRRPNCRDCRNGGQSRNIKHINSVLIKQGMRLCRCCNETKAVNKFNLKKGISDGIDTRCKNCQHAYQAQHYKKNKGKISAYQSMYYSTDVGKRKRKEKQQRELTDPKARIKIQARGAVNDAVRRGKMPPALKCACANCDSQAKEYHHHLGYEKEYWLDVIPLCKDCHKD